MKAAQQSIIEKAIAFIGSVGSARSPAIAEHTGIKQSSVQAVLAKPLEEGYLVACKIEIPGKRAMNEYRLSASVSESKQTWADFKAANRVTTRPLKIAKERPPREPPESKRPSTAIVSKKFETPASTTPPPILARAPAAIQGSPIKHEPSGVAAARDPARMIFMVDSNGRLRIEMGDKTIICTTEETRDAGELLVAAEPIWSE